MPASILLTVALALALAFVVAGRKTTKAAIRWPGTWRLLEVWLAGAAILAILASLAAPNTKAWQDPILGVLTVLLVAFSLSMVRFAYRFRHVLRAPRTKTN